MSSVRGPVGMVAILGRGMAPLTRKYKRLIGRIGDGYTVQANIGVSGGAFRKFGTGFETRLLVIDRIPAPARHSPVFGAVEDLIDYNSALGGPRCPNHSRRAIIP